MLRAVVFDFDGVIQATEEPELLAWHEEWARHGGHLRRLELVGHFAALHCYDGRRPPKPAPDLYRCAIEALGVDAADAVAIEHSAHGVAAATRPPGCAASPCPAR